MKLVLNLFILMFNRIFIRRSTGYCLRVFCSHMGIAYIKLCQILALQNIGNLFTEHDRQQILSICYYVNPVSYSRIKRQLKKEYGRKLSKHFAYIDSDPIGSASVSQVHRATLQTGEEVVLKVKRKDVMKGIDKDIKRLNFLCRKFGWIFGITNNATEVAWRYYLKWLREETDFRHEVENIYMFQSFASSVEGVVSGTGKIRVPEVYGELCTDNVIVMEYVPYETIHKSNGNRKVSEAINSYVRQSFYALFHDMPVVFHGDMHPGNLFVDDDGNLGFLDMGLVFKISPDDAKLIQKMFMCEWTKDVDGLATILRPWFKGSSKQYKEFKSKLRDAIYDLDDKCVSSYFMDIVFLCFDVDIEPPYFLFCMAKAFVCLFGADSVYLNNVRCRDMIGDLVLEYMVNSAYAEGKDFVKEVCKTASSIANGDSQSTYLSASNCLSELHVFMNKIKTICNTK